jgi:hypothetical protein
MTSVPSGPPHDEQQQTDWRRIEAEHSVPITEYDAQAILIEARKALDFIPPEIPRDASEEERRAAYEAADQRMADFRKEFGKSILRRQVDAYLKGLDAATDREATRAVNTRSIVLLLVVLAVVSMPILAMVKGLSPQSFGAYIAPVTGIAGTVVGYWFGASDRRAGKRE